MNKIPIKGENLMIWVEQDSLDGNGSHALVPFALSQDSTLTVQVDSFETTSKDDGSWKSSMPGMKGWSVGSNNLYCNEADSILALQIARTIFYIYWFPAHNTEALNQVTHTPTLEDNGQTYKGYFGKCWINNFNASTPNADASNVSMDLTGTGALVPTTSIPTGGIGVSRAAISMKQGESAETVVTFATGALSATTSNANVTCTITNGVATISAADDCPAGAYIVTIADAGTSTTAYVFVTVTAA